MKLPPPPGRLIDVGGHRLHLHCTGAGPAVVFDAALGASSLSWTYVAPLVAQFVHACVYDRAGCGWSEAGPLPRTAGQLVDELRHLLLAAETPRPYVLVGHSFGAMTARVFASRYPDDVAGLVLLDPVDPQTWRHPSEERRALLARAVALCRHGERAARLRITDALVALIDGQHQRGSSRRVRRRSCSAARSSGTRSSAWPFGRWRRFCRPGCWS